MPNVIAGACVGMLVTLAASQALAQGMSADLMQQVSTVTVHGRGVVVASPDQVVIDMGAVAQADRADAAQTQVNTILQRAIGRITASGVPVGNVQTTGITLSPVYSGTAPAPAPGGGPTSPVVQEPRIVAYRASNTLRVQLNSLQLLGQVIDAAVLAGANQLENLSFQLKDDAPLHQEALARAATEARVKAQAIAGALGVQIVGIRQVEEAGLETIRPQVQYRELTAAPGVVAATPVQPGQIRVEAAVNVTYLLGGQGRPVPVAPATQPQ